MMKLDHPNIVRVFEIFEARRHRTDHWQTSEDMDVYGCEDTFEVKSGRSHPPSMCTSPWSCAEAGRPEGPRPVKPWEILRWLGGHYFDTNSDPVP